MLNRTEWFSKFIEEEWGGELFGQFTKMSRAHVDGHYTPVPGGQRGPSRKERALPIILRHRANGP